jgi:hypothetical protein
MRVMDAGAAGLASIGRGLFGNRKPIFTASPVRQYKPPAPVSGAHTSIGFFGPVPVVKSGAIKARKK